jgi:urease accessory protein
VVVRKNALLVSFVRGIRPDLSLLPRLQIGSIAWVTSGPTVILHPQASEITAVSTSGKKLPAAGNSFPTTSGAKNLARVGATAPGSSLSTAALYRLMAWLSPAYPVGAFSYSGGLEWAVEAGDITDAASLKGWLASIIGEGGGFCDAVLLVHAHRAVATGDDVALAAVAELAAAFTPTRERFLETTAQGRAFFETTRAAWGCAALDRLTAVWDGPLAYPIAVAVASAGHDIALEPTLAAFLQAVAGNLVSAGLRLVPLGQTDGQRVLAGLEPVIAACVREALASPLDQVGSAVFRSDIASMRHETQYTRLFRS